MLRLGRLVQIGAELREGRQVAELRQVELERASDLLHARRLRGAADAAHRDTDVQRGTHASVEEVRLQEIWPSVIEMTFVGM